MTIETNPKDKTRCSRLCQHITKIKGVYHCTKYDECVDTGEDDEIGYGFKRTKECLYENEN